MKTEYTKDLVYSRVIVNTNNYPLGVGFSIGLFLHVLLPIIFQVYDTTLS